MEIVYTHVFIMLINILNDVFGLKKKIAVVFVVHMELVQFDDCC